MEFMKFDGYQEMIQEIEKKISFFGTHRLKVREYEDGEVNIGLFKSIHTYESKIPEIHIESPKALTNPKLVSVKVTTTSYGSVGRLELNEVMQQLNNAQLLVEAIEKVLVNNGFELEA